MRALHRLASVAGLVVVCSCSKPGNDTDAGSSQADLGVLDAGVVDGGGDASASGDLTTADTGGASDLRLHDAAPDLAPNPALGFDEAVFRATHNSYSGGTRGPILEQLERGIRFLEFDVHSDDFGAVGYSIGHDAPGDEVDYGAPNPDDDILRSWLDVIVSWRADNPEHLPLTIGLDAKDALYAAAGIEDGNLAALNALMVEAFGDALVRESEVSAGWPSVDALRGRVLVVLSGDTPTRLGYRRTLGAEPAVAASADHMVIAHEQGTELVVWSGSRDALRRYDRFPGADPAVALAADGTVVLVWLEGGVLQHRTGVIGSDDVMAWDDATPFGGAEIASNPSIRFTGPTSLREIHQAPGGELRYWDGTIDPATRDITWLPVVATEPRFDETTDGDVVVSFQPTPPYGDVLFVDVDGSTQRVRLNQVMFSESQFGGPAEFEDDDVYVFAADAFSPPAIAWAEEKRRAGGIVRLWKFNLPNLAPQPPMTFPATDYPDRDYYLEYCASVRCQ